MTLKQIIFYLNASLSVIDRFICTSICAYSIHNSRGFMHTIACSWNFNAGSIMCLEKLEWQSGMAINYREFSLINCTPRRAIACSRGTAINTRRSAKGQSRFVTVAHSRITQAVLRSIV